MFNIFQYPLIIILSMISILLTGCSSSDNSSAGSGTSATTTSNCILYSTTLCSNCVALKNQLNAESISFTEKYTDTSVSNYNEMLAKVQKASWYTSGMAATYPIVDVKGTILENPTVATIKTYLDSREENFLTKNEFNNYCIYYSSSSVDCPSCATFKQQLINSNIFCKEKIISDSDVNEENYNELLEKLNNNQNISNDDYIFNSKMFLINPIIEINGQLLINPSLEQIELWNEQL
ncbi:MAG: hypothetical protein HQK49_12715 [Oligoflexia bacterium]|nr:hypothetical protein [Oligoflexia bacterium]